MPLISIKKSIELLTRRHGFLYAKTIEWEARAMEQGRPSARHSCRAEIAAIRRALWEMGVHEDDLPKHPPFPKGFKPTSAHKILPELPVDPPGVCD